MTATKEPIFERLKHSVQLLASPAEVQLRSLPDFVCKGDELALDFDQWHTTVLSNYRSMLTANQLSSLAALNEKLDWLSNKEREYWSDRAVCHSDEWEEIRGLARKVLESFQWPEEIPPSHANEFRRVQTDK